jgi:hypothetical protein
VLQKHSAEHPPSGAFRHRHLRNDERIVPDRAVGPGNDCRSGRGDCECTPREGSENRVFPVFMYISI